MIRLKTFRTEYDAPIETGLIKLGHVEVCVKKGCLISPKVAPVNVALSEKFALAKDV